MNLRSKFFLLILMLLIAFAISASAFLLIRSQAGAMQSEKQTLTDLRAALLNEGFQANRIAVAPLGAQVTAFKNAIDLTNAAFTKTQGLKVLPKVSASIENALSAILALKGLLDSSTTAFLDVVTSLQSTAQSGSAGGNADLYHFALAGAARGAASTVLAPISDSINRLNQFSETLSIDINTIDDQYTLIDRETQRVAARSSLVAILTIVLLVAGTIAVALVLTGRIVRSVRSIEDNIALVQQGNLTQSFAVETNDEIGRLSRNLNGFLQALRDSITSAQSVSSENVRMKESLINTTEQASSSTAQIGANTDSIDRQIAALDKDLESSSNAIRDIADSIATLNSNIQEQLAMVEESTASVTEMIASIDNVTKISERRREAAKTLVASLATGGEKMVATVNVVNRINESVGSIKEITNMIDGISSQTSLLAMNAAIEAAHAGDSGRGFSVVAGEIRKLAEATALNSQEIGKILQTIVARISEATSTGAQMSTAFREIDREVKGLHTSLEEIADNMRELRTGGDQILQAMSVLQGVSVNVKGGSDTINQSSRKIRATMDTVTRISSEAHSGMAGIAAGIKEIITAVQDVLATAQRLGELGESLNSALSRFTTSEQPEPAA